MRLRSLLIASKPDDQDSMSHSSEMVDLLVRVVVGRLVEHLLRLFGQLVLVVQLDPRLQPFNVGLLRAHIAVDQSLLPGLVFGLEVESLLEGAVGTCAHTLRLGEEAGRVRAWLVIQESVWVGRLSSEARRRHEFYRETSR